ncbi:MAG: hypothetical protein Q9220_005087 [cf. Caloplaca sp. 1 TL-2023]
MDDVPDTPPTNINPYEILAIKSDASISEVKSAYKAKALSTHPDKAAPSDKATATTRFQQVAFAYAILSDPRRRKLYDSTGSTSETLSDDDFDWLSFFRTQFSSVGESLHEFTIKYKNSEEEHEAVLRAYTKHQGRLNGVYEEVMLSNPLEDEDRFKAIIDKAIEDKKVESYKAYTHETKASKEARMRKAKKEAKAAEKEAKTNEHYQSLFGGDGRGGRGVKSLADGGANGTDLQSNGLNGIGKQPTGKGKNDLNDLAAMIQSRNKARSDQFFDDLEAKYATPSGPSKGKKRKADEEPSEEAFQKTKTKMMKANAAIETPAAGKGRKSKASAVDNEDEEISMGKENIGGDETEEEAQTAKPTKKAAASKSAPKKDTRPVTNGTLSSRTQKGAKRGRQSKATAEDKDDDDDDEDGDIDLEKESDHDEDGTELEEDEEEEREPKSKSKKRPAQKAKPKRTSATVPKTDRVSRGKVKK